LGDRLAGDVEHRQPPGPMGVGRDKRNRALVEFPGWWLDVNDALGATWAACEQTDAEGRVSVLAHPERCPAVAADPASAVRFAPQDSSPLRATM
jgi:hypothetical protein